MNEQIKFDVTLNKYVQKYLNSWAHMDLYGKEPKETPRPENFWRADASDHIKFISEHFQDLGMHSSQCKP